jgi:hypothetical protein
VKESHPDQFATDPEANRAAEEQMKLLNEAFEFLKERHGQQSATPLETASNEATDEFVAWRVRYDAAFAENRRPPLREFALDSGLGVIAAGLAVASGGWFIVFSAACCWIMTVIQKLRFQTRIYRDTADVIFSVAAGACLLGGYTWSSVAGIAVGFILALVVAARTLDDAGVWNGIPVSVFKITVAPALIAMAAIGLRY